MPHDPQYSSKLSKCNITSSLAIFVISFSCSPELRFPAKKHIYSRSKLKTNKKHKKKHMKTHRKVFNLYLVKPVLRRAELSLYITCWYDLYEHSSSLSMHAIWKNFERSEYYGWDDRQT